MPDIAPYLFLAVVLKVPVIYAFWLIYWAWRAEENPFPDDDLFLANDPTPPDPSGYHSATVNQKKKTVPGKNKHQGKLVATR